MLRTTALLVALLTLSVSTGCIRGDDDDDAGGDERERAIAAAMAVYVDVAATGQDLSSGPCIADELEDVPGWSVDIAHDPRQEIDNDPANQCQAYRDGRTSHFVELDPEGQLIRAQ
jgi:hypothetical protein